MLYLHIGAHKTGTSSIQATFFASRQQLLRHGVDYFSFSDNHSKPMLWRFGSQRYTHPVTTNAGLSKSDVDRLSEKVDRDLRAFFSEQPDKIKVISGEELSTLSVEDVGAVRAFLRELDVETRVIIYIRNYFGFMNSEAQELVKWGWNLNDIVATVSRGNIIQPNYRRRIEKYISQFGRENVDIRIFDPKIMAGGDLLRDFCKAIGAESARAELDERTINTSVSGVSVRLLSELNRLSARPADGQELEQSRVDRLRKTILAAGGERFKFNSPAVIAAYRDSIRADAEYIRTLLGDEVHQLLVREEPLESLNAPLSQYYVEDYRFALKQWYAALESTEDNRTALELMVVLSGDKHVGPAEFSRAVAMLGRIRDPNICLKLGRALARGGRVGVAKAAAERAAALGAHGAEARKLLQELSEADEGAATS